MQSDARSRAEGRLARIGRQHFACGEHPRHGAVQSIQRAASGRRGVLESQRLRFLPSRRPIAIHPDQFATGEVFLHGRMSRSGLFRRGFVAEDFRLQGGGQLQGVQGRETDSFTGHRRCHAGALRLGIVELHQAAGIEVEHGRLPAAGRDDFTERRTGRTFTPDAFCAREKIRLGRFCLGNESRRHVSVVDDFQPLSAGDGLVENRRIAVDVIESRSHGANMRGGCEAGKPLAPRAGFLRRFCPAGVEGKAIPALSNVNVVP